MDCLRVTIFLSTVFQVCKGGSTSLTVSRTPQYFTSPAYPSNYGRYEDESWYLTANDSSDVITLEVEDADLEYSSTCAYDYVILFDGPSSLSPVLKRFCGTSEPTVTSSSQHVHVKFNTDGTVNRRGFNIRYWSSVKLTSPSPFSSLPILITAGVVVGAVVVFGFVLIWYHCCSKKHGTNRQVRPATHVSWDNTTRGRHHPMHFPYNAPRGQTSAGDSIFYSNPNEALPGYGSLYPTSPPPPYSEIELRASPIN
ncbi:neuropilin-2-like [Haliotis rufescens]|uniref:neuropilin-2-like n=1 Tax=Haliotis rufescens TaxID=6454 RepID=UPI001EAFE0D5|nr:neuropilin-2-like [Haliotis rufescens]